MVATAHVALLQTATVLRLTGVSSRQRPAAPFLASTANKKIGYVTSARRLGAGRVGPCRVCAEAGSAAAANEPAPLDSRVYTALSAVAGTLGAAQWLLTEPCVRIVLVLAYTNLFARTDLVHLLGGAMLAAAGALQALRVASQGGAGVTPAAYSKLSLGLAAGGLVVAASLLKPTAVPRLLAWPSTYLALLALAAAAAGAVGYVRAHDGNLLKPLGADIRSVFVLRTENASSIAYSAAAVLWAGWAGLLTALGYWPELHAFMFVRIPFLPLISQLFTVYGGLSLLAVAALDVLKDAAAARRLHTPFARWLAAGTAAMGVSGASILLSIILDGWGHTGAYLVAIIHALVILAAVLGYAGEA